MINFIYAFLTIIYLCCNDRFYRRWWSIQHTK
jgi:hypothetical protein